MPSTSYTTPRRAPGAFLAGRPVVTVTIVVRGAEEFKQTW
jgi:hypothetical protein